MVVCQGKNKNYFDEKKSIKILIFIIGKNSFLSIVDTNYCPFIETLSFGSDFRIQCNNSYLIFNQINVSS